jgi:hypothetical protein
LEYHKQNIKYKYKEDNMKAFKILSVLVLGVFLLTAQAIAVPILDFGTGTAGPGGSINDLGGGNVSGVDIRLDAFSASGTPIVFTGDMSGALPSNVDITPLSGSAALNFNTQTGAISVVGGIPGLGIANVTLLTGTISNFSILIANTTTFSMTAGGIDVKDESLLRALGIDPIFNPFTFVVFELAGNTGATGYPYTATSTDLINTGKIPEPISLILLGSGLAGAGLVRRWRKK